MRTARNRERRTTTWVGLHPIPRPTRGRGHRPSFPRLRAIIKRAVREAVDDQIPDSAAAIAYYSFLAIPALLLVSVGVFSLVASPSAIETIIEKLGSVIPAEAATLLEER